MNRYAPPKIDTLLNHFGETNTQDIIATTTEDEVLAERHEREKKEADAQRDLTDWAYDVAEMLDRDGVEKESRGRSMEDDLAWTERTTSWVQYGDAQYRVRSLKYTRAGHLGSGAGDHALLDVMREDGRVSALMMFDNNSAYDAESGFRMSGLTGARDDELVLSNTEEFACVKDIVKTILSDGSKTERKGRREYSQLERDMMKYGGLTPELLD